LPDKKPVKILITSGASCPDAMVEGVITKIAGFFKCNKTIDDLTREFMNISNNEDEAVVSTDLTGF